VSVHKPLSVRQFHKEALLLCPTKSCFSLDQQVPLSSRASVGECGDGTSKLSTGLSREHSKTKKLSAYDFR